MKIEIKLKSIPKPIILESRFGFVIESDDETTLIGDLVHPYDDKPFRNFISPTKDIKRYKLIDADEKNVSVKLIIRERKV